MKELCAAVLFALVLLLARDATRRPAAGLRGTASWYGDEHRGKPMANRQPFDPEAMTCAMWDLPFGTLLRVTHLENGQFVVVEVTDRGPARWTKCLIDLSARAFRRLADPRRGKIEVEVTIIRLGPEPIGAAAL